ncbi:hypothetical protein MRX96_020206 [Rhipicephalus microplus]
MHTPNLQSQCTITYRISAVKKHNKIRTYCDATVKLLTITFEICRESLFFPHFTEMIRRAAKEEDQSTNVSHASSLSQRHRRCHNRHRRCHNLPRHCHNLPHHYRHLRHCCSHLHRYHDSYCRGHHCCGRRCHALHYHGQYSRGHCRHRGALLRHCWSGQCQKDQPPGG